MAELSAAGLEALANQYYNGLNAGAADLSADYRAAAAQAAAQAAAAEQAGIAAIAQQQAASAAGYDAARAQALRLSGTGAIGNTDAGVPAYPETQTAELMRRNALQNMTGSLGGAQAQGAAELQLLRDVGAQQILAAQARQAAAIEGQYASMQGAENQAGAGRELSALSMLGDAKQNSLSAKRQEDAFAAQKAQDDYNNAIKELNTFGVIMTKAAAEALGVPIGTKKSALKGGGKGRRSRSVTVTDFSSGFNADGTPKRLTYLYETEDEYNQILEGAITGGNVTAIQRTLQSGIYDGLLSPQQAQKAFDEYKASHETSVAKGRSGRLRPGDY